MALGINASLWVYFVFIPLIIIVMQIPITVSGLGVSQAMFDLLFTQVGVPKAEAFALSVLFIALAFVGNLPVRDSLRIGPRHGGPAANDMIGAFLYVLLFCAIASVGLPIGFAPFGRRHAAGWVAGALTGYGVTAVTLWMLVQTGITSRPCHDPRPVVYRPWTRVDPARQRPVGAAAVVARRDTTVLVLVLLIVPLLQWRAFTRIGEPTRTGRGDTELTLRPTSSGMWHSRPS